MDETFVLCRSVGRKEKENAILNRFVSSLETRLLKLAGQAQAGKVRDDRKSSGRSVGFWNVTVERPRCSASRLPKPAPEKRLDFP